MGKEMKTGNEEYYERVITAALRISFVALLFRLSYIILKPFLMLVVWSVIIAVSVYPLFEKLSDKLGRKQKLVAALIAIIGVAIITVPSVLMTNSAIQGTKALIDKFERGTLTVPPPEQSVAELPVIGKPVYEAWQMASVSIEKTVEAFRPQIEAFVPKLLDGVMGIGGAIFLFIIAIIIAAVFLLQAEAGEKTTHKVLALLSGANAENLTNLIVLTIRSVVQGILGIAFIQSFAAGVLMLAFGIPGAGLWALIVLLLAIMQLPPTLILLPVAIYAFSIMSTTSAIIFLILALLVSVSDTILKPFLLGRGVDVPMLVVLLGAIGGMIAFGILGLFVGAVVLAVAYKVFQALIETKTEGEIDL